MVEKVKKGILQKVLVTGSRGMLGTDLCLELADSYNVAGLDMTQGAGVIQCDITDKEKTLKSIVEAKPDIVIHAAAWTNVDGCEKDPKRAALVNVDGTTNVAFAASKAGAALLYISTDFVFDGKKKLPYNEGDLPAPLSVYAKAKLEGEKIVSVSGVNYVIVRSGWLYGKNGINFVSTIIDKAKSEEELKVVDDQVGSPTYTKDLAKAIAGLIKGLTKPFGEIVHISNRGEVSWFDYAKEIVSLSGIKGVRLVSVSSRELGRPAARPSFSILDNTKFEKITGFSMRPWKDALKEYINEKR